MEFLKTSSLPEGPWCKIFSDHHSSPLSLRPVLCFCLSLLDATNSGAASEILPVTSQQWLTALTPSAKLEQISCIWQLAPTSGSCMVPFARPSATKGRERERLKTMRKDKMSARHSFGSQWSIIRFEGPTGGRRQETSLRPQKWGSFMFCFFGSRTLPTNNVICGRHPERGQGVHSIWFFPGGTKASAWVYRTSFDLFELLWHNNSGNAIVWLAGIFFWKVRTEKTGDKTRIYGFFVWGSTSAFCLVILPSSVQLVWNPFPWFCMTGR